MSSVVNQPGATSTKEFLPPPYAEPHIRRQLDDLLREVEQTVSPVWPLKDYVAVNPYAGMSGQSFAEATRYIRLFSDCEMLMPVDFFARQWRKGAFGKGDLVEAIEELGYQDDLSVSELLKELSNAAELPNATSLSTQNGVAGSRLIRTIAEVVESTEGKDWTAIIREEITKHCSAYYDQGEAAWAHPSAALPLFQAWRSRAAVDRGPEMLGLSDFRRFVAQLPHTADAAILSLLQMLGVPEPWWQTFLLCQAFSIPGWSSWAKYQSQWKPVEGVQRENDDFIALLAIRLAYDVALSQARSINFGWNSLSAHKADKYARARWPLGDSKKRLAMLRAMEIAYRNQLLDEVAIGKLAQDASTTVDSDGGATRKLAQLVFCIDVRSERLRRHLEATNAELETFGFAGFFAMPVEYVPLGSHCGDAHLPVLLKPTYQLHERLESRSDASQADVTERRFTIRRWRKLWKQLQMSSVGCFPFVETIGLSFSARLVGRVLGWSTEPANPNTDGMESGKGCHHRLVPELVGPGHCVVTLAQQVDLAESLLRNLGLIENFARLVAFCGHASQTTNNPLAASLDCGACGGHSGEPNARLAAHLLNDAEIREGLESRGISIPGDTHFVAGLHNTTTDEVTLFDHDLVPASHAADLLALTKSLDNASQQTRLERMPSLDCEAGKQIDRKAQDWSEVRPEWGLAGNAAMIVGPRRMTQGSDLDGRTFLHSYEHDRDPDGSVLTTILSGPMVVAHWINMQYYASSVDPIHFGSGTKTVHNVVGQFGLLSGSGGDLMTGLPWQSVHTGRDYRHIPQRLQVVVAAPRQKVEQVMQANSSIADLLNHRWLFLAVIEEGQVYHYGPDGEWRAAEVACSDTAAV